MAGFLRSMRINPFIEIDRTQYPFTLPVFKNFEDLEFHPRMTFFVGDNGSGKSTLLEAIAVNYGFSAEGGTKHHNFSTCDTHSPLHDQIQLSKTTRPGDALFLRAESFYNVLTYAQQVGSSRFGDLHERSHGEGFLDTMATLRPHGLYLMDEPESALSVVGQFTLLARLKQLIHEDSQFLIATHSPILLGLGEGIIYELGPNGFEQTSYRKTSPYTLTLDFLRNRDRYVDSLGLSPIENE